MNTKMQELQKQRKDKWLRRFAYGSGDAACNISVGMLNTVLVLYYTDYVGMNAAVVGAIMFASKFIDGIFVLLSGFLVERTHSRLGKYRSWILWTSVPFALTLILLFTVPMSTAVVQYIYIFVVYNLSTSVFYNTINVPYAGLAYVMTRDSGELNMFSMFRNCGGSVGRLIAVCGTMPLVKLWGDSQSAWVSASVIWAVIALGLLLFCFYRCRENVEVKSEPAGAVWTSLKYVVQNKYFWCAAMMQTLQVTYNAVTGTSLTYYSKYILGNDGWLYSGLFLTETLSMIAVMMFCPLISRRYGKRALALLGCVLMILGQALFWIAPTSLPMVFLNSVCRSVGFAPFNCVVFAVMGEAVEYGYWKKGQRQEGLICASSLAVSKIGGGAATACMTGLLALSGYISTTAEEVFVPTEQVADMILNIYRVGPILIGVVGCVVLFLYRLEKKMPQIMAELKAREQA